MQEAYSLLLFLSFRFVYVFVCGIFIRLLFMRRSDPRVKQRTDDVKNGDDKDKKQNRLAVQRRLLRQEDKQAARGQKRNIADNGACKSTKRTVTEKPVYNRDHKPEGEEQ